MIILKGYAFFIKILRSSVNHWGHFGVFFDFTFIKGNDWWNAWYILLEKFSVMILESVWLPTFRYWELIFSVNDFKFWILLVLRKVMKSVSSSERILKWNKIGLWSEMSYCTTAELVWLWGIKFSQKWSKSENWLELSFGEYLVGLSISG